MNEEDGFDDIPTLTDVVRPGNPSLVFHLDGMDETSGETAAAERDEREDTPGEETGHQADTAPDKTSPVVELGLPEDFFTTPASEPEGLGNLDLFDDDGAPAMPAEATLADAPAAQPPDGDTAASAMAEADDDDPTRPDTTAPAAFDADSLLIRLEVPISEILQRHWESAREEILDLIRAELRRQHED